MSNITYENKQVAVNPANPQPNEIFSAVDANEVKTAVNSKQDNLIKPSIGFLSGESTTAAYVGQNPIAYYLFQEADTIQGTTYTDISLAGAKIAEQKADFLATSTKSTFDWMILNLGHNNILPDDDVATKIAALQDYIDTINANRKEGSVLILSTIPCALNRFKVRFPDPTVWPKMYASWLAYNEAIMGNGATPITGVDVRTDILTTATNDGFDALPVIFDYGDGIHQNNVARKVEAAIYRDILNSLGFLNVSPHKDHANYVINGFKAIGQSVVETNSTATSGWNEGLKIRAVTSATAGDLFGGSVEFEVNDATNPKTKNVIARISAFTYEGINQAAMFLSVAKAGVMKHVVRIFPSEKVTINRGGAVPVHTLEVGGGIRGSYLFLENYTVATLPSIIALPTGIKGIRAYVTDSITPTYMGVVSGGGSVSCPVFNDGTNWIYA